jgi:membrane associated rhomboid family serine protease
MAFLHDGASRQPFLRVPPVVIWLILVLAAAYVYTHEFLTEKQWVQVSFSYGFVPARYSAGFIAATGLNPGSWFDRALPFVSYIFLHANITHLLINSIWFLAFGPVVARRFGTLLFIVFFLVCGVAGAATHLVCNWGSASPVIGASGAISGLMAASFRMLPVSGESGAIPLAPILSPRILVWSSLYIAVNVVTGLTGYGSGAEIGLVAWQAHLGGFAAGLLLAGLFDTIAPGHVLSRHAA